MAPFPSMQPAVMVTGAAGLLGRAVTRQLLDQGHPVIAVVRPNTDPRRLEQGAERVEVDLAAPGEWADVLARLDHVPITSVVHLAQSGRYREFPSGAEDVLAIGGMATVRLATLAVEREAKSFLLASSGGVYAPQARPLTERDVVEPAGAIAYYLSVKRAAEELLSHYRSSLQVSVLRYFFVYGPGQKPGALMPRLLDAAQAGRPVELAGRDGPRLNPIFVDDAAAATIACLGSGAPHVLNVAGTEVASLREICARIGMLVGRPPVLHEGKEHADDLVADISLLEKIRQPHISLDEGLKRTLG